MRQARVFNREELELNDPVDNDVPNASIRQANSSDTSREYTKTLKTDFLGQNTIECKISGYQIKEINGSDNLPYNDIESSLNNQQLDLDKYVSNPINPTEFNIPDYFNEGDDAIINPNANIISNDRLVGIGGNWIEMQPSDDYINPDTKIPWKIHIRINPKKEDWAKMTSALIPYLTDRGDTLFKMAANFDKLPKTDAQAGKGIVIYPQNKEHFESLAKDLAIIMDKNGLCEEQDSNGKPPTIEGDRVLGSNGRLFYRYESKFSNQYKYDKETGKESIIELANEDTYIKNRGGTQYMNPDMTEKDDPFYDFDPLKK